MTTLQRALLERRLAACEGSTFVKMSFPDADTVVFVVDDVRYEMDWRQDVLVATPTRLVARARGGKNLTIDMEDGNARRTTPS